MITATSDHIFGFATTLAILSAERIIKNDLARMGLPMTQEPISRTYY
jgi:hypothetical protein